MVPDFGQGVGPKRYRPACVFKDSSLTHMQQGPLIDLLHLETHFQRKALLTAEWVMLNRSRRGEETFGRSFWKFSFPQRCFNHRSHYECIKYRLDEYAPSLIHNEIVPVD